jgi:WD40 repeat protein
MLLTGAGDGTAALWNVSTGRELRQLDGQADVCHKVAFTPDGKTIVATVNDGDLRLWDTEKLLSGADEQSPVVSPSR